MLDPNPHRENHDALLDDLSPGLYQLERDDDGGVFFIPIRTKLFGRGVEFDADRAEAIKEKVVEKYRGNPRVHGTY